MTYIPQRILEAVDRARPLCPNHRDKQHGKTCLACRIERLEKALAFYADRDNWRCGPDETQADLRIFDPPTRSGPAHGWEVAEIALKGASR